MSTLHDAHDRLREIEMHAASAEAWASRCRLNADKATSRCPESWEREVIDELASALKKAREIHAKLKEQGFKDPY